MWPSAAGGNGLHSARSGRRQATATATAKIAQRLGKAHQADVLQVALMPASKQWIALDSVPERQYRAKAAG